MLNWKPFVIARKSAPELAPSENQCSDRRTVPRALVFKEALLELEEFYKIRAIVTDMSDEGARVHYSTRVDLPFRITIICPELKLHCRARVVWQDDGAAGLEFLESA